MTKDELHLLGKRALEDYGRTLGVELDRRLSKSRLVEQVLLAQESFIVNTTTMIDSETTTVQSVPVAAVETVVVKEDKYKLVRQGDSWSVSHGLREIYKTSSEAVAKKWIENN